MSTRDEERARSAEELDPDAIDLAPADARSRALIEEMFAAGANDPDMKAALAASVGGRPSLDPQKEGPSPMIQGRVPLYLKIAIEDQAKKEGRRVSDLLRDAAVEYLKTNAS